ncbi:sigma-70 family RNA polymerase sigma factor [Nostoc sp. CHAB 5834]|nr:sigma-70 family RNA polymerase sigma factor [Nostoc sp. CHAB 5834]
MSTSPQTERFLIVLQNHKGIIYQIARTYCPDAEDRQDLVQDIVLQLWKAFDTYSNHYQYSTWIYRIALNVAISRYRKHKRHKSLNQPLSDSILTLVEAPSTQDQPDNLDLLHTFIAQLKPLDKALVLLYLDEKTHLEIAHIMGLSQTNVATKISRLKTSLRQQFSALQTH